MGDRDTWFVQLPNGDVRALSLDALDAAFQAGAIDEATLVRRDGQTQWRTLAAELSATDASPEAAPNSIAPQIYPASAPPPPVALDDDDAPFAKKKGKKGLFLALAAAAVVGGAAFTVVRVGSRPGALAEAAAAAPPTTNANVNTITAPAVDAPKPSEAASAPRLSDDQKKKVLEADKKRLDERKRRDAEQAEKRAKHGPGRRTKSADPIRAGGNKFDPLNGAL